MRTALHDFPGNRGVPYVNAGAAIAAGAIVLVGSRAGIAITDIAASTGEGMVALEGCYKLTKGTGYTVAQGANVAWDGAKVVNWSNTAAPASAAGTLIYLGRCRTAAGSSDTTVEVDLGDFCPKVYRSSHVVTSGEAAANSGNGRVDFDIGFTPTVVVVNLITASTKLHKTAYKIDHAVSGAANTVRVDGVGSGTQVDEGDIIEVIAFE